MKLEKCIKKHTKIFPCNLMSLKLKMSKWKNFGSKYDIETIFAIIHLSDERSL